MTDDLTQIFGRISAHEFLIEFLYAKWMTTLSDEAGGAIVEEIRRLSKSAYLSADAEREGDLAMDVARYCSAFTNRLLDKAVARAATMPR